MPTEPAPAVPDEATQGHSAAHSRWLEGRVVLRKKILLIDDSSTILMMEKMILRRSYDVITAKDGDDGVAAAIEQRPDLILLDVIMPKMNGFQVCRRLRAQEATMSTPIIFVTGKGEASNMEEGFRCGCSDYIIKPVDASELLEKVRNCLGE